VKGIVAHPAIDGAVEPEQRLVLGADGGTLRIGTDPTDDALKGGVFDYSATPDLLACFRCLDREPLRGDMKPKTRLRIVLLAGWLTVASMSTMCASSTQADFLSAD
jgi:hypothetical protein